ncbi:MAG: ABC transporter permease [Planctomycetes bacterium]|nr:ABC transporter permease [Planctomycetota bacterium]
MRSLAAASWLIARAHFTRTLFSRRLLLCIALTHLPALFALVTTGFRVHTNPDVLAANLGWMMFLQIVLPLVTLIAGSAVISEEVEDRTITYLFTRPIPRASLLFGRWISTFAWLVIVIASGVFFLLLACERARGRGGEIDAQFARSMYEAALWGAAAYSALFSVLGAFFRHAMLVGIGYAFAVEGFLANLPGQNQALTVQYYLRSLIADGAGPVWKKVEGFSAMRFVEVERAQLVLIVIIAGALVLGAWRLMRRQFAMTA